MKVTLLVCLFVTFVGAEYKWDGTDWKWVAEDTESVKKIETSSNSDNSRVIEGSGDDYNDSFDDEEDYDDDEYDDDYNVDNYYNNKNNGFDNPTLDSSDDEDLVEGSGGSDFDTEYSDTGSSDKYPSGNSEKYPDNNNENKESTVFEDFHESDYEKEKEKDLYVDVPSHNFDFSESDHSDSDISFDPDMDQRVPHIEVTSQPKAPAPTTSTTTTERQPVWATGDREESPEVHRKGPTSNRPASFFAQPGILAAVIGGAVVGLLCAILLVMFIVYRMRKKDEGSYALDEPKRAHNVNSYAKPPSREFYA